MCQQIEEIGSRWMASSTETGLLGYAGLMGEGVAGLGVGVGVSGLLPLPGDDETAGLLTLPAVQ